MQTTTFPDPLAGLTVLAAYEQNLAHDSYFYAVTWDGASVRHIEYGATAYGGPCRHPTPVDDPQARRAAAESLREPITQAQADDALFAACTLETGQEVVVARGRKVPKGTVGIIGWMGTNNYGRLRLRLDTASERIFIDARNVDPVDIDARVAAQNSAQRAENVIEALVAGRMDWRSVSRMGSRRGSPLLDDAFDRYYRLNNSNKD